MSSTSATLPHSLNSQTYDLQNITNDLLVVILSMNEFNGLDLAKTSKGMYRETLKAQRACETNRLCDFRSDVIRNLNPDQNQIQITSLNALVFRLPENIPNYVRLRQLVDAHLETIVDELTAVDLKELGELSGKRDRHTFIHAKQDLYPYYFYSVFRDAIACKALMDQTLFKKEPNPFERSFKVSQLTDFAITLYGDIDVMIPRVAKRFPIERLVKIAMNLPEETQCKLIDAYCDMSTDQYESGAIDKLFELALDLSDSKMQSRALNAVSRAFARTSQLDKARQAASLLEEVEQQKAYEFIENEVCSRSVQRTTKETIKPEKLHCFIGVKFFSF